MYGERQKSVHDPQHIYTFKTALKAYHRTRDDFSILPSVIKCQNVNRVTFPGSSCTTARRAGKHGHVAINERQRVGVVFDLG